MRISLGARHPNQTLLSGPAAGVIAGAELARVTRRRHVITFDMGGTSTDISVIVDGRLLETTQGQIAGQDIGTPMLQVRTLGAGGGTIAWIGKDGLLKVGPQQRRARCRGPPATAAAARSRRSPTPMSLWARSAAIRCSPARCASTRRARARAIETRRHAARPRRAAGRRRHHPHRQHPDGGRPAARIAGAGAGPAQVRARRVRRRRAAACGDARAQRGHPDRAGAALSRVSTARIGMLQTSVRHSYLQVGGRRRSAVSRRSA